MPRSTSSNLLTNERLREALAARDVTAPASSTLPGTNLPLIEPIWAFWMEAAQLARLTTAFAARQVDGSGRGPSRGIPKVDLPASAIASLKAWLADHRDGSRAAAREANYLAHYGLRLPGRGGVKSSPFLEVFQSVLLEAIRHEEAPRTSISRSLMLMLRRLHVHLSRTASLIVDGLPPPDVFPRLGESLSLGRADLLVAQSILASPAIAAALRGHILVAYPDVWMSPLDRLRQLTRTLDSLSLFYDDLAVTSERLLLSIRFGNWMQASSTDAANWATFWQDEMARYLIAYQEVTGSLRPKA